MRWEFPVENYEALIRCAPYLDLEAFKERLIARCEETCESRNDEGRIQLVDEYKKGTAPTLPHVYFLSDMVYNMVAEDYPEALDEPRYGRAMDWIVRYFFDRAYWRRVRD